MIKHNQYKRIFLIVAIVSHICGFIAIADELKWGKWRWEEMGYVDCEVRFASNTSECGERGKTREIIIEARDILAAYQLYLRQYGKTHQKSGYALERRLPYENHNYVFVYEMPLDIRYGYTYSWSDDKSSLSIDFWLGVCKSNENTCTKARLTFIDMSKEHSEIASSSDEIGKNDESDDGSNDSDKDKKTQNQNLAQESMQKLPQESTQKSPQESKSTSFSGLDSKIISFTTKQNTKNAKPTQNRIKIIATVW